MNFPTIIIRPYPNLPLTEQTIYDLQNSMRKINEMNDFHDDDFNEYEDTDIDSSITTWINSTTLKTNYALTSSSFCFVLKFTNLLLLLLLIQTNK